MKTNNNHSRGSVLITLLLVIILVVLAYRFLRLLDPPRQHTAGSMACLKEGIVRYYTQSGHLPDHLEDLQPINGLPGALKDAWGRPIAWSSLPDGTITLISLGRDGKTGGSGDDADMTGQFSLASPNTWLKDPYRQ